MASSDGVLRYNSYGRKYEVPRKLVSCLCDLKSGDHIAFHRPGGCFWHHAIVDGVDKRSEKLVLIEYSSTSSEFFNLAKAEVVQKKYSFVEVTAVHLMLHECSSCYPADTVVERARSKRGENTYSPFTNNCEHFAMWCKTGRSSSDQVNKAAQMVTKDVSLNVAGTGARATAEHVGRTVSNVVTRAAKEIPTAYDHVTEGIVGAATNLQKAGGELLAKMPPLRLPTGGELPPLLSKGVETVTNLPTTRIGSRIVGAATNLQEAGGTLLAKMPPLRLPTGGGLPPSLFEGAGRAANLISRGGQAIMRTGVGGVLSAGAVPALIEGLSVNRDVNNLQNKLHCKKIDRKHYDKTVKKRYMTGASSVTGSTLGTLAGQFLIPIPFVGAIVGAAIGGVGGRYLGNIGANLAFGEDDGDGANCVKNSKEDNEEDLGGADNVEESDEAQDNDDVPVVGPCGRAHYADNDDVPVVGHCGRAHYADNDDVPVVEHCGRAHYAYNDDVEGEEDNFEVIAFPESDGGADYGKDSDEDNEEGLGGGGYYSLCGRVDYADIIAAFKIDGGADYGEDSDEDNEEGLGGGGYYSHFSGADYAGSNYVEDGEEDFSVAAYH